MKQMFYGGVHPAEHKEATEQKPIQPLANAPAQVVIPMSMHIGAPCKPVVQKGDTVTVGQKIGEIGRDPRQCFWHCGGSGAPSWNRRHAYALIENDFKTPFVRIASPVKMWMR